MKPEPRYEQDLLLLGGGHTHALLIRRWGMQPIPGVRLSLVSSGIESPYSGMLPGLVAGHYRRRDMHIDLLRLCAWAGVRFIRATAQALDLDARRLRVDDGRPPIGFDLLSLDTGSTPDLSIEGAAEHVIPVKPIAGFERRWQALRLRALEEPLHIAVVGSGAAGLEMVLALQHALSGSQARLSWVLRGELPLSERPQSVAERALAAVRRAGIEVVSGFDVVRVDAHRLLAQDGRECPAEAVLWATGAVAPHWLGEAGLATDARGFVLINDNLQSISHEFVLATGDVGTHAESPWPKAGVHAVRQAPVLYDNLQRWFAGKPLRDYRPQKDFLALMALGGRSAIGNRGALTVEGEWVWRWKDRIDRRFMQRFQTLPAMADKAGTLASKLALSSPIPAVMRCRGCGAKLDGKALDAVLGQLDLMPTPADMTPAGDAAIIQGQGERWLQSVDQLNAIIDDPWQFARMAALHALSDITVLESEPHSAQVLVTLPDVATALAQRDLEALMHGLGQAFTREGVDILGGHTALGQELTLACVVNARLCEPAASPRQPAPGDVLVLTQGLGVGVLFAALMQGLAAGRDVQAAIDVMLQSNRPAAALLRAEGALAMTDITGFGLLGHARRLLDAYGVSCKIDIEAVPWLAGARQLAEEGVRSSLWPDNRKLLDEQNLDQSLLVDEASLSLLLDPQTGGGLLAVLPGERARQAVEALQQAGYTQAAVIGRLLGRD